MSVWPTDVGRVFRSESSFRLRVSGRVGESKFARPSAAVVPVRPSLRLVSRLVGASRAIGCAGRLGVSESDCNVAASIWARAVQLFARPAASRLPPTGPGVSGHRSEGGARPPCPERPPGRPSRRGARAASPLIAHGVSPGWHTGRSRLVSAGSRALSSLMAHGPSVPIGARAVGVSRLTGRQYPLGTRAAKPRTAHGQSVPVWLTVR